MRKIKTFESFNFDELSFISESKVYYLPSLRDKLIDIYQSSATDDVKKLAETILDSEGKDLDSDTTFIGLPDNSDMCTFSRETDVKKVIGDVWNDLELDEGDWGHSSQGKVRMHISPVLIDRIENSQTSGVKIGKLIRKVVPGVSDKTLENLVNLIKSYRKGFEIKVVEGDEIAKYYDPYNCKPGGTLGNSCMMGKGENIKYIFDIYTKNPQAVKLVVLIDPEGECVARGLLWNVSRLLPSYANEDLFSHMKNYKEDKWFNVEGEFQFLDRVYYVKEWQERMIFKWADEKDIAYKCYSSVIWKGKPISIPRCEIKLNKLGYRNFPYLDTFKYYNVKAATISNYQKEGDFDITSTQGNYYGGTKGAKFLNYVRRFKDII